MSRCDKHDCELIREYPKDGMGKFFEYCPECRKERIEKLWKFEDPFIEFFEKQRGINQDYTS